MAWTYPLGVLAVSMIAVTVLGSVLTLATDGLLAGAYVIPVLVVLGLLAVSVAASVSGGVLSSRFLSNPYW